MCADLMNVESTLRVFEKCGIEMLHVDIMDGVFVPNYTLGPDFCKCVRRVTDIPLDIHLMVKIPKSASKFSDFAKANVCPFTRPLPASRER